MLTAQFEVARTFAVLYLSLYRKDFTSCGDPGSGNNLYDTVAEFRRFQWTLFGSLDTARRMHGSITYDGQTMVIGGRAKS